MNNVCRMNGHTYVTTTSDIVRRCKDCNKPQMLYLGVWIDKPKEPVKKTPKQVEDSQLQMF